MKGRVFVLEVSILPLSTNLIFDFRIVSTVWYFFVFYLFYIIYGYIVIYCNYLCIIHTFLF